MLPAAQAIPAETEFSYQMINTPRLPHLCLGELRIHLCKRLRVSGPRVASHRESGPPSCEWFPESGLSGMGSCWETGVLPPRSMWALVRRIFSARKRNRLRPLTAGLSAARRQMLSFRS